MCVGSMNIQMDIDEPLQIHMSATEVFYKKIFQNYQTLSDVEFLLFHLKIKKSMAFRPSPKSVVQIRSRFLIFPFSFISPFSFHHTFLPSFLLPTPSFFSLGSLIVPAFFFYFLHQILICSNVIKKDLFNLCVKERTL